MVHLESYVMDGMLDCDCSFDKLLGGILLVCLLFGVPGNCLALGYFRSTGRTDLAAVLYLMICCVDAATCFVQFPTAVSLFLHRAPGLFSSTEFCIVWAELYEFLLKLSVFLATLLSVTRAISICWPFYKMRNAAVFTSVVLYIAFIIITSVIFQLMFQTSYVYGRTVGYCYSCIRNDDDLDFYMDNILWMFHLVVPLVVATGTFFFSTGRLACNPSRPGSFNKTASVTIALYTGFFLICNLPYALIYCLLVLDGNPTEGYSISRRFPAFASFSKYIWLVSKIVLISVNAALNPLLYYCRITGFRTWISRSIQIPGFFRLVRPRVSITSIVSQQSAIQRSITSSTHHL